MIARTNIKYLRSKISKNLKTKESNSTSFKENYSITRLKEIKKLHKCKQKEKELNYYFGKPKLKKKYYFI